MKYHRNSATSGCRRTAAGSADLLPEITSETQTRDKLETSGAFVLGLAILLTASQLA